jgi:hypothetical protein
MQALEFSTARFMPFATHSAGAGICVKQLALVRWGAAATADGVEVPRCNKPQWREQHPSHFPLRIFPASCSCR